MQEWLKDVELDGKLVKLRPMTTADKEGLLNASSDGKLWELWYTSVPSAASIDQYIQKALDEKNNGKGLPFVVINKNSGDIIGATRYCNAAPEHRRLEIGYTYYARHYQRTGVNRECKYLLLQYAFEVLNCIAVEFRTNWFNQPSRTAIAKLGAKQDGILRNHQINPDGSFRDTVVFSITNQEWTGVKRSLIYGMEQYK